MTGDSGGMDSLPPLDRDNRGPSGPGGPAGDPNRLPARGYYDDGAPDSGDTNPPQKPVLRYVPGTPGPSGASGGPLASNPPRMPSVPGASHPSGAPGASGTRPGPGGAFPQSTTPRPQGPFAGASSSGSSGSSGSYRPSGFDERTQELPAGYLGGDIMGPRRPMRPQRQQRSQGPLVIIVSVLIVLGVIAALVATPLRNLLKTSNVPLIGGCGDGSPCQAATTYLADYGSGDYESMYTMTSSASHARFGDADTRGGYKDGHDYIVNRTKAIVGEGQVTSIQTTIGDTSSQDSTHATVTAHVLMSSARVGQMTQDLKIHLVKEGGKWLVDWTPGLIFSQLDDPSDPHYQRLVHLFATTGARGTIFDRDGNALAKDDTVYDVNVDKSKITNETSLDNALATDLSMTAAQVKAAYTAGHPVRTISKDYYATISAALGSLPGVSTQQRTARVYPFGADMGAITGYASGVTPDDLKNDTNHYYCDLDDPTTCGADDVAGHSGVEAWAEQYLRPVKGGTLAIVERNADGSPSSQPLATLGARQEANGADVHTTISLKDQQAAMHTLAGFSKFDTGAGAFALDPVSGEVLVMASVPACDPNDFSLSFGPGIDACGKTAGAQINHALASAQPVGSVFKVVTLAAALQHGIAATTPITCTGHYLVPGEAAPRIDDNPGGHGVLTPQSALGPSCDVVYWTLSVQLNQQDPTFLPIAAKDFGFGTAPQIVGLPDGVEAAGQVPDPQWLKQNKNATWTATDAANLAIGQGFFLATPAQVALAAAAIADNGVRMQPRLVTSITGPDGSPVASFAPKQIGKLSISANNLQTVQMAMLGPTQDPNGTAYSDFVGFPVLVAGKTGTAESGTQYPHGWFMGYAPASKLSGPPATPKIASAVLTEYMSYPSYAYGECYAVPTTLNVIRAQMGLSGNSGSMCKA